jgi:two-component system, sensor histidine kinase LadS
MFVPAWRLGGVTGNGERGAAMPVASDIPAWPRALVALLLVCAFLAPVQAAGLRIDDALVVLDPVGAAAPTGAAVRAHDPIAPIGRQALMLRETRGDPLTLEEARTALSFGAFSPTRADIPNLGNHPPPMWLHYTLRNEAQEPRSYRLYIVEAWADRADVWVLPERAPAVHWQGGDERSPGRDLRPGYGFAFDTAIAPGRSEVFIRIDSVDSAAMALRVVPLADTGRLEAAALQWSGLVHGYLLALAVMFGLLWTALRERALLRYVGYVSAYLYMHLTYSGVLPLTLYPEQPFVGRYAILVGMVLYSSAGLSFARVFLALGKWSPRLDRGVQWGMRTALAGMLLCIVADLHAAAVALAFAYITVFTLLMVWLGVLAVRQGVPQARSFLLATLCGMAGAFLTTIAVMGVVPFNTITFRAMAVSVMCEASLWALALGIRMRRHRDDRAVALAMAEHDALTGVYNRRGFLDRALPLYEAAARKRMPLALLMLDIDHFKALNDRHGHEAGDQALVAIARRLSAQAGSNDVVARWGGEEFVLLLPRTGATAAARIAERLRLAVAGTPVEISDGIAVQLTASIGIGSGASSDSLEALVRQADAALYAAKEAGRNRVCHAEAMAV